MTEHSQIIAEFGARCRQACALLLAADPESDWSYIYDADSGTVFFYASWRHPSLSASLYDVLVMAHVFSRDVVVKVWDEKLDTYLIATQYDPEYKPVRAMGERVERALLLG
jgi:hypothetical protein